MIKSILVATDGSDHANKAVELGADIAGKYGARIVVLHALMRHISATDVKDLCRELNAPTALIKMLEDIEKAMLDATMASGTDGTPVILPVPYNTLREVGVAPSPCR